jgi:protein-tyrosine phosphatase
LIPEIAMLIDCNEIIDDKLWVGSYVRADDTPSLRQMGITLVISLQSDRDLSYYNVSLKQLLKTFQKADIQLHRVPISDFDKINLLENLPRAVDVLERALAQPRNRIYLHCSAGINRAPTLAAAYYVKARNFSAKAACDYVLSRRNCAPYLDVLESYESTLGQGDANQAF